MKEKKNDITNTKTSKKIKKGETIKEHKNVHKHTHNLKSKPLYTSKRLAKLKKIKTVIQKYL